LDSFRSDFLLKNSGPVEIETKTDGEEAKPPEPKPSCKQPNAPTVRTPGFFPSSIIGYYHPQSIKTTDRTADARLDQHIQTNHRRELPPDIVGD
jgi:hypothetical protein